MKIGNALPPLGVTDRNTAVLSCKSPSDESCSLQASKENLYLANNNTQNPQIVPGNQIDFQRITGQLASAMHEFTEAANNSQFTTQTLEEVQNKFWTSASGTQAFFCLEIWKCCEGIAKTLSQEILSRSSTKNNISENTGRFKLRTKPVVLSTREGLDITFDLKSTEKGLLINSACVNPGGSSINVARALNNFGTPFELLGIRGYGPKSDIFTNLLEKEGINTSNLHEANDDIRFHFCTFLNGKEYWIVALSPYISPQEIDKITTQLLDTCENNRGEVLALANNPFIGAPTNYMPEIITKTQDKSNMFVIYDTKLHAVEKELLNSILNSGPSMIKPNLAEYSEIVQVEENKLRQDKDLIIHLAQELINKHDLKMVLVSLDKDGALLIDKKRAALAKPPQVTVASTVGAGDTGIAAMIDRSKKQSFSFKKANDNQFKDLISAFVAGGAATVTKPGTELGTLKEVENIEKDVRVRFV